MEVQRFVRWLRLQNLKPRDLRKLVYQMAEDLADTISKSDLEEQLVFLLDVLPHELDDLILAKANRLAAEANAAGLEAQVDFLLAAGLTVPEICSYLGLEPQADLPDPAEQDD